MATMRDIKRRKASIQSTQQITNAMKLVSTVKLQKSRAKAERTRPYTDMMYATVNHILSCTEQVDHPYLTAGTSDKKGIIVISSNRGLAGGYNSNVARLITGSGIAPEQVLLYAVGRKGRDVLCHKGYTVAEDYSDRMESPEYSDALEIGRKVLSDYMDQKIGEIYLVYTSFKNTVSHEPKMVKLLPVETDQFEANTSEEGDALLMSYEPGEGEVLDALIPLYMNSLIYGALVESTASENGARMQAMDSATSNAQEMLEHLSLEYNRARQASITQEITEIIAGANAIG
ncbi:MAG: ATP synthase F1 subunit gamma [Lachnospiraceae bacterium]|nr:ATP synthase F1 subunit gamma [Lachnospiraceae bacterium]